MNLEIDVKGISTGEWARALDEAAQKKGKSEGTRKVQIGNNRAQKMSIEQVKMCTETILKNSSTSSYAELRDLRSSFIALKWKDGQEHTKLRNTFSTRVYLWKQKNKGLSKLAAVVSMGTIYLVDRKGQTNEARAKKIENGLALQDEMIKQVDTAVANRLEELAKQVQNRAEINSQERMCLLQEVEEVYSCKAETPQLDSAMENWQKGVCEKLQPKNFSLLTTEEKKQVFREANKRVLIKNNILYVALLQEELVILDQARNYSQLKEEDQQQVRTLLPFIKLEEKVAIEKLGENSISSVLGREQSLRKKILRDHGVKSNITVPSDEDVQRMRFAQDFIGTQLFAREVPPTERSVDLDSLVAAFESVVHLLPKRIQDDNGTQSLESTRNNLAEKLNMANEPGNWSGFARSKNALSQLVLHIKNRTDEIDQEVNSVRKKQLQSELNEDLVQIFSDQLGPAVHHCSDRLQLAAEQIYFERIAQEEISQNLSLGDKLQRKVAGAREDIFRAVCMEIAKGYRIDESSFAQSALELLGKKADIPRTNTQQSTYTNVFARYVRHCESRILADYRKAYTPAAALRILADEVSYQEMRDFLEDRFDGLFKMDEDDEDGSSAPIMQLVTEQGKVNQRALALLMQEMGMVRPFI